MRMNCDLLCAKMDATLEMDISSLSELSAT